MIVGLSTGCFCEWNLDVYQEIGMILKSKSNAIQISFPSKDDFLKFKPVEIKMDLVVVHLPWKGIRYGDNKGTKKILKKIKEIVKTTGVNYFVIHPNDVEDFKIFEGFNVLVENLRSDEKFGSKPDDLKEIKNRFNLDFLLDLTHVYKRDKRMKELDKIVKILNNRIKALHVSGFKNGYEHSMLYNADNRDLIIKHLKRLKQYPIILEGKIPSENLVNMDLELIENLIGKSAD
jgi:hypothetical protein